MDGPPKSGAELLAALGALEAELKPEMESVLKYRELMADAEKHLAKATGKFEEHARAHKALTRALAQLRKAGKASDDEAGAARARLAAAAGALADADALRPATGSIFVRAFLGQVNVRAATTKDRAKLRDEYNKFKDRTNLGFVVFPLVWIFVYMYLRHLWRYTHWIHILTHIWMLYYYVSLSLRENILKVNGSNIKKWWIVHHYLSSIMSITVLTWPADSVSWDFMTPHLTAYFAYQGLVQVFQARYQKSRHYARMAMGKAAHMDVVHTETLTEWHRGLAFITVLVFVAQLWQLFLGYTMLFRLLPAQLNPSQPWYDFREEVQCVILGAMFLLLGVVNSGVTVQTLLEKRRQTYLHQAAEEAEEEEGARRAALARGGGERTPTSSSAAGGFAVAGGSGGGALLPPQPLRAASASAIPAALGSPVAALQLHGGGGSPPGAGGTQAALYFVDSARSAQPHLAPAAASPVVDSARSASGGGGAGGGGGGGAAAASATAGLDASGSGSSSSRSASRAHLGSSSSSQSPAAQPHHAPPLQPALPPAAAAQQQQPPQLLSLLSSAHTAAQQPPRHLLAGDAAAPLDAQPAARSRASTGPTAAAGAAAAASSSGSSSSSGGGSAQHELLVCDSSGGGVAHRVPVLELGGARGGGQDACGLDALSDLGPSLSARFGDGDDGDGSSACEPAREALHAEAALVS